ncbi:MAG: DUF6427 family protein [Saprospiraceae bacterium]|nr:DUF6427 family protein [Saprospiraceae bacterium]
MLELFRKNHFFNSLLLLPYSILLAVDGFFVHREIHFKGDSPLYELTFSWLDGHPVWNVIFAAFLLFIQAAMINRLVIQHRMSRVISLLPGLTYIVLMNAVPAVRGVHDILIANTFLLLFLLNCFQIIRLYNTQKNIFNMGFFAAFSAFFFPGYLVLIIYMLIAMLILRNFSMRELRQALTGFVTVMILIGCLYYVLDEMNQFLDLFGVFRLKNWLVLLDFSSIRSGLILIVTYILLIIAVLNFYKLQNKQSIKEQKKIKLIYWLMLLSLPGLWFVPALWVEDILQLSIPLGIILGMVIAGWKMKLAAEFIHIIVVIGILYLHFQQYYI